MAQLKSHEEGRPLVQGELARAQQAWFTTSNQAWYEASSLHLSGRPEAWSRRTASAFAPDEALERGAGSGALW